MRDNTGAALHTGIAAYIPSEVVGSESVGYVVTSNPDEYGADRDTFIVKVLEAIDADGTGRFRSPGKIINLQLCLKDNGCKTR